MARELRDSSAAWGAAAGAAVSDDADVNARARFYGGAERSAPAAAGPELVTGAGDDAGAAIADALARVAVRIRAGEVELPPEAVGASDESALAAALAALLRGPRH